ncbi:DUF6412 domain-containing protein [Micromonospora zhanjiangensis]|uniref:DUF6412 domain-containing protein n=1 Tax=Micromonospora zhanjiangensis TaxID=1522057 RepID=A0ABV8KX74_9ACTN
MPELSAVAACGWAYALTHLATVSTHPAESIAGAAVAVAVLLALGVAVRVAPRLPAGADPARGVDALRDRIRRGGVPRQLDPDADGRPRPRAPAPRRVDTSRRASVLPIRGDLSVA